MSAKKWCLTFVSLYVFIMLVIGLMVIIVDPFFHYHKPIEGVSYSLEEENYVNNGIIKHFDYNAMITGSSMTKAFKVSEADSLFEKKFVRITNQGEGFKRINDNIEWAIQSNPNLEMVIRGVDPLWFISDVDWLGYEEYPEYLYDDNLWNDVEYLYNREILARDVFPTLVRTIKKVPADHFDNYGIGKKSAEGKERILANYKRPEKTEQVIDEAETERYFFMLEENLKKNVIPVIEENKHIDFYLFFPPYSICWWDTIHQSGSAVLERRLDLEAYVVEKLLEYENVYLYSFYNNFELICDLNNYVDTTHYADEINSQILQWMKEGKYRLTKENYKEYLETEREFYCNYDYDSIFE